ncbi:11819_t:CDS:2 [Ambispora gerdemannii]|uniref:11819_t:CDS:1 n=1 Tax=Ambispora gerdemannii TaxID=144530 RepID=A0A9N9B8W0_9GLOM|nr:11819_t:CDS:2 [Ambispora gerdemannii]
MKIVKYIFGALIRTNTANGDDDIRKQQTGSKIEDILGATAPNRYLGGTTWTAENPRTPCRLVLTDNQPIKKYGDDSSLYQVSAGGDRCRVAASLCLKLNGMVSIISSSGNVTAEFFFCMFVWGWFGRSDEEILDWPGNVGRDKRWDCI